MRQAFLKFLESLISRKVLFAFINQFEKTTIISAVAMGLKISWELVAIVAIKDVVILALMGLVQFEKVQLSAKVGNG